MSKPIYKAQERPYTEDLNDLIEKGGVGSGVRGHKTNRPESANPRESSVKFQEQMEAKYRSRFSEADLADQKKYGTDLDVWEHMTPEERKTMGDVDRSARSSSAPKTPAKQADPDVYPATRTKSHENIDKQVGFAYDMNSQTSRMNQFKTALRAASNPSLVKYAEANIRRAAKTLKLSDQVEKLFKDAAAKRAESKD